MEISVRGRFISKYPKRRPMRMFTTVHMFNVALRFSTLGARFVLVFVLAKFLDAASVGNYGLFTATIGYALLCVGLDLYVFTTREITRVEADRRGLLIKSQLALVSVIYLFLAPIMLLALPKAGLPPYLVWWFLPILVLEHFNQEVFRLLIALSEQISASILLFLRQGSWALGSAALLLFSKDNRNLEAVLTLWVLGGAVAAVIGMLKLRKLPFGGWSYPVDWKWIKSGVAISATFLIATLALRGVQTIDRYWLKSLAGINIVGAYVLFFGVGSALNVFLDAAIFSFKYPELINLSHESRFSELRRKVRQMTLEAIVISVAFAVISTLALPLLLSWIGKTVYLANIDLYFWVLAAIITNSLSMIPHYALYALGHDRKIVASHVCALGIFAASTAAIAHFHPTFAVPVGVFLAMGSVLVWKTVAYLMLDRHDMRNLAHFPV